MQRDSISHYVGLSVGRSVPHLLFWRFASSLRITAPAQPHAIKVVVYTAPHSAPALPPIAPAPPAPQRGAHRSCPTKREHITLVITYEVNPTVQSFFHEGFHFLFHDLHRQAHTAIFRNCGLICSQTATVIGC